MQTAAVLRDFPAFFEKFVSFSPQQQHDVVWALLEKTDVLQLRRVYEKLGTFLAFDIIGNLPDELSERILSHLDGASLSYASLCSRAWRRMANKNSLWRKLCVKEGFDHFEDLPVREEDKEPRNRPMSPSRGGGGQGRLPRLPLSKDLCHWRVVYMTALNLQLNWKYGVYTINLMRGHKKPVTSIACDGKLLVSGSNDNTARVWNLQSEKCVRILENHSDVVTCVALKDGLIVTACADSLIRVYQADTGVFIRSLKGHTRAIECMEFDGRVLVTSACDLTVRVWNVRQGVMMFNLIGHSEEPKCIAMQNGLAATGSWDNTLRVWNIYVGMCKYTLVGHSDGVFCCMFFEALLYSGGGDGCVKVWDIGTGQEVMSLDGDNEEVYCLAVDKSFIISGSGYSNIRVWNHSGEKLHVLKGHMGVVRCLHLTRDRLISGGDRKMVIVWNTESFKQDYALHRQSSLLHLMWVDHRVIVTASPDSPGLLSLASFL